MNQQIVWCLIAFMQHYKGLLFMKCPLLQECLALLEYLWIKYILSPNFDVTMQNFIYKHIVDLENVQRNKKKEHGEFIGHQVSSN
jgi:hypothetical protein